MYIFISKTVIAQSLQLKALIVNNKNKSQRRNENMLMFQCANCKQLTVLVQIKVPQYTATCYRPVLITTETTERSTSLVR